jgi:hypothetical protein
MARHLLQRFLLTLPAYGGSQARLHAVDRAVGGVWSFRIIGDSRQSVRIDKIRWYER